MARLTAKKRKSLPNSSYAIVTKKGRRRFPINDKEHARKALQLLPLAKGLTSSQKSSIKRKARLKLYGTSNLAKISRITKNK